MLVNTGSKLVLLDAGNASSRAPTSGQLPANLAAAGIDPKAIDLIVISHFHADHIGGLRNADNALAFPNAEIMVPAAEWAFWMDDGDMSRAPEGNVRNTFRNVRRIFGPIADKVARYEAGKDVAPGIGTIATPGHTPGHASFILTSGSAKMVRAGGRDRESGDQPAQSGLAHGGRHGWSGGRGDAARLYDMVAADRIPISGYHHPFPAVGYAEKDGDRYRLVPVSWNPAL